MSLAITLPPDHAALIAVGVKTIATLPGPPFSVPDVARLPGHTLNPGDRVLIHAAPRGVKDGTKVGDLLVVDGLNLRTRGGAAADGWRPVVATMAPGHIVASAVLRNAVPITRPAHEVGEIPDWCLIDPGPDSGLRWTEPISHARGWKIHYCEDQRPYGDFTPGLWALLFDDVEPTTERCPACWGSGIRSADLNTTRPCGTCGDPTERLGVARGKCQPIPWTGKQGVWTVKW